MTLIDSSYFVGPINIPAVDKPEVAERLQWFIDKWQAEFLECLMGYELFKTFSAETADYDGDGSNSTIAQRWLDIIEGAEFTWNTRLKKYKGLIYEVGTTKESMIANYVYWQWIKDQYTQTTQVGEATAKQENAENANPASKMVRAWNEMSEQVYSLYLFLQKNVDGYPEWISCNKEQMLYTFRQVNLFGF